MEIDINSAIISEDDWRSPIITYLRYPTPPSEKRVRIMASNYLMWNEDLVRKSKDEVLLSKDCFIIVATDYFTKWVEAKPVKSTTSQEIITFIEEQIIQRFGIPESITSDRGSSFISRDMLGYGRNIQIQVASIHPLLCSS
ncbi:unnamed protein product [Prunus brigantina]